MKKERKQTWDEEIAELRELAPDVPEEELPKLNQDLDTLTEILFDYFVEQRKHGRKITDPWIPEEKNGSNDTNGVCG